MKRLSLPQRDRVQRTSAERPILRQAFFFALSIAVAFDPLSAYALRPNQPRSSPETLAGLEERLGAKHRGVAPTPELLEALQKPSNVVPISGPEIRKLDRDIGAVMGLLARVEQERLDWTSYRDRRLMEWLEAVQQEHQAMAAKRRIRAPGYDAARETALRRRADQTRLVVEGIPALVPEFRELVVGAARVLEQAADGNHVTTFDPPADLLAQILRIRDPEGRADFLVAFEVIKEGQGYLYLLAGLADDLRSRAQPAGLLPALLAHAGVELFLLGQWERFLALDSVQRYMVEERVRPEELREIYQELVDLIAEDLERVFQGIRFEDEAFTAPYSPLDDAISDYASRRLAAPVAPPAAAAVPAAPPAQPPSGW